MTTDQLPIPLNAPLAGVELSMTGAAVTGALEPDEVAGMLGRLATTEGWTRWVAGDLVLALDAQLGDPAATMRLIAPLGFDQAWLGSAVAVAERVPAGIRRTALPWGVHAEVARLVAPDDEDLDPGDGWTADHVFRDRWLEEAVSGRWTVRGTRERVDRWLTRDQGALDGVGEGDPVSPYRLPPVLAREIGQILAVDPDAWLAVHPKTREARLLNGAAKGAGGGRDGI